MGGVFKHIFTICQLKIHQMLKLPVLCSPGGWWEVCVQVCVWPRGSVLHGLPRQPEAQPEGGPRQPARPGWWHTAPHTLRWKCSLSARCWGAVCGRLVVSRWLWLLICSRLPKPQGHTLKIQSLNCWAAWNKNHTLYSSSFPLLLPGWPHTD